MSINPFVTEELILRKVTEKSFERGRDYYESGMVESVTQRGNRLFADVLGSECEPYNVGITLEERDFRASCTCPYDWEGYCKHIVAVLLTWIRDRELVAVRLPVEDLLSKLDPDELRTLVLELVESGPALAETVDEFCRQVAPTA